MAKKRDLWSHQGGTKAINRPQRVYPIKGWDVTPELLPFNAEAPRRRKYAPIRPNARDAVATPLPGQSYNPRDEDHQAALAKAVKALQKKKRKDAQFVKTFTMGRDWNIQSSLASDKNWTQDNDVQSLPVNSHQTQLKNKKSNSNVGSAMPSTKLQKDISINETSDIGKGNTKDAKELTDKKIDEKKMSNNNNNNNNNKKKKKDKKKKDNKLDVLRKTRRSLTHRRHPQRDYVLKEVDELDTILASQRKAEDKKSKTRQRRRDAKKANLTVKHYGRHYYTPTVVDVAPSTKLVGSLRHLAGSYLHPAMERMKSIEERNLVPARMRHTYNKRKMLKPKSVVRVKRESVGVLPTTDF